MRLSIREMAKLLNRNPSTISRELKRNSYKKSINYSVIGYFQSLLKKYNERRKNSHRKLKIDVEVKKYVEDKLNKNW